MEILAFTHAASAYEDPSPAPQLRELDLKLPNSAWVGIAALTIGLSIVGTAPSAMAAVQRGDVGPEVTRVQEALGIFADGIFGPGTEGAVLSFQTDNGLVADGIVGPQTEALLGIGTDPGPVGTTVRRGDSGAAVTEIQDVLKGLGFFPAAIASTGFYGSVTEQAVIDFQAENGLVADGIAGPATQGLLFGGTDPGPISPGTVRVSTNGGFLNVRSGPGLGFPAVGAISNGVTVGITGDTSGGWLELSSGGWISSDFVI